MAVRFPLIAVTKEAHASIRALEKSAMLVALSSDLDLIYGEVFREHSLNRKWLYEYIERLEHRARAPGEKTYLRFT